MPDQPRINNSDWVLLVLLSVVWGSSFSMAKIALADLPPFTIVFCRTGLSALVLITLILLQGQKIPTGIRIWREFLTMGLLNNLIPFSLIFWGQTQIESGLAAILNATTPIFTVILAHFLTQEKLYPQKVVGILLGFLGVVVLIGIDTLQSFSLTSLGQVAVLVAACSYGCAGLYGRRFKAIPPMISAMGMLTGTTIMLLPVVLILDRPWTLSPSVQSGLAVVSLALLSTAVAYLLYFKLLARVGATNALLVAFLIPITALFIGIVFLNEQLGWNAFVSLGLILSGLAVIDGRALRLISNKPGRAG